MNELAEEAKRVFNTEGSEGKRQRTQNDSASEARYA
jgi:hypothetical protein